MNSLENITFRRTRTNSDSILNNSDNIIHNLNNSTVNSAPEMSDDEDDELKKLREQVIKLTTELQSAHSEIETLSSQNNELKQLNEDLTKKNNLFKKVTSSPVKLTSSSAKKQKNKRTSNKQIQTETPDYQKCHKSTDIDKTGCNSNIKQSSSLNPNKKLSKICILSTDNNNKILSIAENAFTHSKICHYITPHGNATLLLKGLKDKISDFTLEDYCIIMLGEEDFRTTNSYFDIILNIRQVLQEINHTNFILCTPTYKCEHYTNLYNSRVETFNNLLFLDVLTHEYAYLVDSNKNLTYDYTEYYRWTGAINNTGLQIIFKDIINLIDDIQYNNLMISTDMNHTTDNISHGELFRH